MFTALLGTALQGASVLIEKFNTDLFLMAIIFLYSPWMEQYRYNSWQGVSISALCVVRKTRFLQQDCVMLHFDVTRKRSIGPVATENYAIQ